jgi:excisionase family DNA binding protein
MRSANTSDNVYKLGSYMLTAGTGTRPFMSPVEAAALLHVSRYTIYRLIRSGQLPAVRVGGQLRLPRRALALRLAETRGGWPMERNAL